MIAPASRASPAARRIQPSREDARGVPTDPTTPTPGRSLVSRRAIVDVVRSATLGSYGVIGFAGGGPIGRLAERLGLAPRGIRVELGGGARDRARPHRRPRPADRRGRPPGRFGRAVRDPPRPRPRGRPADDPRRRPAGRARSSVAAGRGGRAAGPRRRSRRTISRPAARTSPDGPPALHRRGAPRRDPERRREPRAARRRDQRPQRLPGPGRRHRHEHARDRPGRARRGGGGRSRRAGRADRGGRQPRCADGRPRQLRRDHEPDPARRRRGPRRPEAVQRARPRERPRPRHEDRLRRGRQAGRGHDPDRHPRVVGRGRRGGRAATTRWSRSSRRRVDGAPRSPSPGRRRCCRSCARPASSTRAARGCSGCSRARCSASAAGRSHAAAASGAGRPHGEDAAARSRRRSGRASRRSRTTRSATRRSSSSPPPTARASTSRRSRRRLEALGNSVLVGGDGRMVKVHVHNERPDEVIAYGLSLGTLTRITVENLDTMADDVREARATEFVGARRRGHGAGRGAAAASMAGAGRGRRRASPPGGRGGDDPALRPPRTAPTRRRTARTARTPVEIDPRSDRRSSPSSPATGSRSSSASIGVQHIVRGGQTANPSTGELLRIARLARSREVILLPNNPNVRLAAEQAASICDDRRLVVVPTRNAAEGVAALLAYEPDARRGRERRPDDRPPAAASRPSRSPRPSATRRSAARRSRRARRSRSIPDDGLVAVDSDRDEGGAEGGRHVPGRGRARSRSTTATDATLAEAEAIAGRIGEHLGVEPRSRSSTAASPTTAT